MNLLALDFGTHTGYCYGEKNGPLVSGCWDLATSTEVTLWGKHRLPRRRDPRIRRLFTHLQELPKPDIVVFEDVEFQTYTYQTQLWASFRTAAWLAFPETVIFDCVPVGVLKKFATGSGAADKKAMAKYLWRRYPECASISNDNEIDAIWIHKWAQQNLGRMLP